MPSQGGRHADRIRHAYPLGGCLKVETYYYDIRAGVRVRRGDEQPTSGGLFSRRVLDGRALKKQDGERTMAEIVEAYVNPIFRLKNGIWRSCGQGEGIHLPAGGPHPEQVQGLGMEELKAFCRRTAQC